MDTSGIGPATTLLSAPAVAGRLEVAVPAGSLVVICSDLHLGAQVSEASRRATADLVERLTAWPGPGAVVLNGDCFELLATTEPSVDAILDAHPAFEAAVAAFADGDSDRHVVVTVGNHDGRLAWDDAMQTSVRSRLGATLALSADLLLQTERGTRVVRVEHGHRFDPANAFADPFDPHDTPLGHHVVTEVVPELDRRPFLADVRWLSDPNDFPRFLGSRVVYRELAGRAWVLAIPFLVALLVRTPILVRALSGSDRVREAGRWLLVGGVGLAVDLAALGLLGVVLARRVFRSLASSRLRARGAHQNDPPRAAGAALAAEGFAGFVTGHTHQPELTPFQHGFYANSGCGVESLGATPGRFGLPPVFDGVYRRSWVEIEAGYDLEVRLVLAETTIPGTTRLERLARRARNPRPSQPTVVARTPGGAAWPVDAARLRDRAAAERVRRRAATVVLATALLGLLSAVTPPLAGRLHRLARIMPVELPQAAASTVAFGSLALLLLARGLRRGQHLAWLATVALLGASAVLHLTKGVDVEEAAIALAVALWLARRAADFPVRPDAHTLRRSAAIAVLGPALAVAVSFLLVTTVGGRPGADPFVTPALIAAGLGVVAVVGWLLLGPRRSPTRSPDEHRADRERARALVTAEGGDTLTYFALRDDKQWFFTGSSVVAYSIRNGVCLVSPDPVGPPGEWATTWAEFRAFAAQQGWSVAVVGAQPGWLPIYEADGMRSIYMGDEAIVDCSAFSLEGKARKGLRGAYHRVARAGYTTVFLDPAHLEPPLEAQLRELMTETRHGEVERGFSMTLSRIFDPADTGLLLSVALDPGGRPVAFCQWVPAPDIYGWSLDVMRRRADPDLPNGVTDFVVLSTIDHVRQQHQWGLGLNFAVMRAVVAGERDGAFSELERRVLHKFSESMQIESLWRYNEKYHPYWRPRSVVIDAPEYAAAEAVAIADAEAIWELPVIGRFLGHRS